MTTKTETIDNKFKTSEKCECSQPDQIIGPRILKVDHGTEVSPDVRYSFKLVAECKHHGVANFPLFSEGERKDVSMRAQELAEQYKDVGWNYSPKAYEVSSDSKPLGPTDRSSNSTLASKRRLWSTQKYDSRRNR
jgi:hypothetical protein